MSPQGYIETVIREFRRLKEQADKAIAQTSEEQFFVTLDAESNSLAVIVKHLAGNMRSRWTDFLTSDGEKPDRNRDSEFVIEAGDSKESLLRRWEAGGTCLFGALTSLMPEDLEKFVLIRGERHPVLQTINRQLAHYAYHVGQIVLLAKHLAGANWKTLSIPRRRTS